jgi:hypothetical protein
MSRVYGGSVLSGVLNAFGTREGWIVKKALTVSFFYSTLLRNSCYSLYFVTIAMVISVPLSVFISHM